MADHKVPVRFRPVIRVFVSSTFTDLKHERDALQQKVFPELEQLCASRRFQFQAIDLRWGVPTEASLDHRTMRICFEELRRAQEISPQPNFLVLLGNRYGWRPLPEEVLPDEFQRLEQSALSPEEKKALDTWYRRDDNAVPPVYILQSRKRKLNDGKDYAEKADWDDVQQVLWNIINRAFPASGLSGRFAESVRPDEPLPAIVRFQASATEQEIWRGALGVPNAAEHVLAFVREIENIQDSLGTANAGDFVDMAGPGTIDSVPRLALGELKLALRTRLGEANYHEFSRAVLVESGDAKNSRGVDVTKEHLEEMCKQVMAGLRPIIDRQMNEYWQTTTVEVTPARELELEQNEHRRFGQERAPEKSFIGREEQLKVIRDYMNNDSRKLLVIHGASGSGKTALLARAAQEAESKWKPVVRFIGVTPHSSDVRALLSSLCQELRTRHPLPNPLPEDIGDLTSEFNQHLYATTADRPVVIFLDALDQLSDTGAGRALLWLPTGDLPEHAKLVLSCLSDQDKDDPAGEPYRVLKQREVGVPEFLDLTALPQDQARTILFDCWLPQSGRRLSPDQTQQIKQRLQSEACRQPLYLRILFEDARLWRSYDSPPQLVADTVSEIINALLKRLAEPGNHGRTIETALGYIASARRGLTEPEMLEVLYSDPEYRHFLESEAARTGHKLPNNPPRIPTAIWSRLRFDLAPYLAEHAAPGATVVNFYHRQVADAVRTRFLGAEQTADLRHLRLADYFEKQASGLRRTDEFPWQLAEAKSWHRLYGLLSDLDLFGQIWNASQFDLKAYWAKVEACSSLRMTAAYRQVLDTPDRVPDTVLVHDLGILFSDTGHPAEALSLMGFLADQFRRAGDWDNYQRSLNVQAVIAYSRGDLNDAMKLHKEQERICRALGYEDGLQLSLGNQGPILEAHGDLDGAMDLYMEQERICRELGNKDGLQQSLGNQALILYSRGDLDGAVSLHREKERLCRELGNKDGLSISLLNQALILYSRRDLDGAMKLYKEQEYVCRELGNKDGLSASFGNQALILQDRGEADGAWRLYKEQERICRELGNKHGLSVSLGNQALILRDRGDLDGAMKLCEEQERICRELGNKDVLQRALNNQALILYSRGDADGAWRLYKEQERISRELDSKDVLLAALAGQALILKARGDLEGTMKLHKEEERICRELGNKDGLQQSLAGQALILHSCGDLGKAVKLFEETEHICRELGNKKGLQSSLGAHALALRARGDLDGAMKLLDEQERICRELGDKEGLQLLLGTRAFILQDRKDLDGAMKALRERERICRELNNKDGLQATLDSQTLISVSYGRQALALRARGDLDGAMKFHKEEERICREVGNKSGLQRALGNQALILRDRGDLDGAMKLLGDVERICRELNNKDGLCRALGSQALILRDHGDVDGTMKLFGEVERICRELGDKDVLQVTLGHEALILQERGDLEGAMKLHKEVERICRELGNIPGLVNPLACQSLILMQTGRLREALVLAEEAHDVASRHGPANVANQLKLMLDSMRAKLRKG